jgi:hypothetical protein
MRDDEMFGFSGLMHGDNISCIFLINPAQVIRVFRLKHYSRLILQTLESTKSLHATGEVSYSKTVVLQDACSIVSPLPNTGFWLHKSRRLQLKYAYVP